jgi:hypothetical protein
MDWNIKAPVKITLQLLLLYQAHQINVKVKDVPLGHGNV